MRGSEESGTAIRQDARAQVKMGGRPDTILVLLILAGLLLTYAIQVLANVL